MHRDEGAVDRDGACMCQDSLAVKNIEKPSIWKHTVNTPAVHPTVRYYYYYDYFYCYRYCYFYCRELEIKVH